jgi:uncharacterized damage-inducible protein DinB
MREHFRQFSRYNRWANRRLYEDASKLDDAIRKQDAGAFFASLHGTLNHILVGDRIWLNRITGEGEAPSRLDEILYDDFEALRAARAAEDERIDVLADGLDDARLAAPLEYRNSSGTAFSQPLHLVLSHFFNHQTHHRGQATTLLNQAGIKPQPLDLLYYLRETDG